MLEHILKIKLKYIHELKAENATLINYFLLKF